MELTSCAFSTPLAAASHPALRAVSPYKSPRASAAVATTTTSAGAFHASNGREASFFAASPFSSHEMPGCNISRHVSDAAEAVVPLAVPAATPPTSSALHNSPQPQLQHTPQPPPPLPSSRASGFRAVGPRSASCSTSCRHLSIVGDDSAYTNTTVASSASQFDMAVPKDASRLLLHPLDAQRQQQLAFSLNDRDTQLEELDKEGRVVMLRRQQERRLAWAKASAAAVRETLAVWESLAIAVRDRRTSLQPDGYQTFSFPDGAAVYEGNWKNCYPHGKGCLRRSQPLNDVYEGQWFVGQRCGTGTYHNSEFQILYYGSWLDDKVHGKGELVEPEGVYTGEFVENTLHGYGEYVYNDGHVYKGDWVRGLYEGNGVYLYPSGTKYEGGWLRGCEHGRGTKWFSNGDVYVGEWMHGMPHGTGTLTSNCSTATRVSGQWRYGALHGQATCTFANGSYYTGEWQRGRFHGQGSYEVPCANGEVQRYTGTFVDGKRHGYGEYVSSTVSYTGQWVRDKKEGEGSLQVRGGGTYFGQWKADVPDGEGVYVSTDRKGCHDEVHCEAADGSFSACVNQHEQQRVDLRLRGRLGAP